MPAGGRLLRCRRLAGVVAPRHRFVVGQIHFCPQRVWASVALTAMATSLECVGLAPIDVSRGARIVAAKAFGPPGPIIDTVVVVVQCPGPARIEWLAGNLRVLDKNPGAGWTIVRDDILERARLLVASLAPNEAHMFESALATNDTRDPHEGDDQGLTSYHTWFEMNEPRLDAVVSIGRDGSISQHCFHVQQQQQQQQQKRQGHAPCPLCSEIWSTNRDLECPLPAVPLEPRPHPNPLTLRDALRQVGHIPAVAAPPADPRSHSGADPCRPPRRRHEGTAVGEREPTFSPIAGAPSHAATEAPEPPLPQSAPTGIYRRQPRCARARCPYASPYVEDALSRRGGGGIAIVECNEGCRVHYHRSCWKALDFAVPSTARSACVTPDCNGCTVRILTLSMPRNDEECGAVRTRIEWEAAPIAQCKPAKVDTRPASPPPPPSLQGEPDIYAFVRDHDVSADDIDFGPAPPPPRSVAPSDDPPVPAPPAGPITQECVPYRKQHDRAEFVGSTKRSRVRTQKRQRVRGRKHALGGALTGEALQTQPYADDALWPEFFVDDSLSAQPAGNR